MSALGVQKDAYDSTMETLAGILEQRNKTFGESRASGRKSVIGLSRYQAEICVLEKGEDVCTGTSKANSAIVHGGFDAKTGSLKAKMNVLGNRMMTQVAEELDVPFRRNGAFVLCFDENDMPALNELYERGVTNGVENLKILTGDEAREMEPALSDTVVAALFCPSSGIVCPFELTLGFAENAEKNGVEFKFECGVQNMISSSQTSVCT